MLAKKIGIIILKTNETMKVLFLVLFMVCSTIGYVPVYPDKSRVIAGVPAKENQAPWQVSLVRSIKSADAHMCGGSLIGPKTVLTAAHCCDGQSLSGVKVKYGGLDRTKLQYSTGVEEIKIHPDWNPSNIDYDFCILKLNNTVQEGKNVKIIAIADSTPPTGTQVQLTGWGKIFGILPFLPNHLQYLTMKVLSAPECNKKWKDVNQVTSRMLCATSKFGSSCNGDSGGPLVADSKLVGVVSWGLSFCPPDTTSTPAVYADPVSVKKWIDENTN